MREVSRWVIMDYELKQFVNSVYHIMSELFRKLIDTRFDVRISGSTDLFGDLRATSKPGGRDGAKRFTSPSSLPTAFMTLNIFMLSCVP